MKTRRPACRLRLCGQVHLALLLPIVMLLGVFIAACSNNEHASESTMRALETSVSALIPDDSVHTVAVSVIDPQTGTRYHVNGDRLFHAASTMKVPVMIEIFKQVEDGRLSLDDELVLRNEFRSIVDGSPFSIEDDSDDAIYEHLGEPMTVRDLMEKMIVVSSNLATNLLIDELGADSVQSTSERLGTTRMKTLRGVEDLKAFDRGLSNRATSSDLALLMEKIMTGEAVSAQASRHMIDILGRQQFGEMIPAGLPEDVQVAHKTGQITEIHHDAAIVIPPQSQPYVLVILTAGYEDDADSARLGAQIAQSVHKSLRP